jgi:stage III sporulation protein AG
MHREAGMVRRVGSAIIDFLAGLVKRADGGMGDIKPPQLQKIGILVFIGLIGVLLLLFSFSPRLSRQSGTQGDLSRTSGDRTPATTGIGGYGLTEDEARLERRLAEILSQVQGAGRVGVKVTFVSGRLYDYAENQTNEENTSRESDTQGTSRETTQTRKSGEIVTTQERTTGLAVPVVRNFTEPRIQGVLVVADGAKDVKVKKALIEAVTTLLDIPYHKVAVLPRQR